MNDTTWGRDREAVVERFVEVCRADDRIVAAFLGGSLARSESDAYSDVDLCVVVADDVYEAVVAAREELVRSLGTPVLCEDDGGVTFFILDDGIEGELHVARAGALHDLEAGSHRVLLDEGGVLPARFPEETVDESEQREELRRIVTWFWHELGHCITALGRDQLWWAAGQLEAMRGQCVNVIRLRAGDAAGDEPYWKIDAAIDPSELDALRTTFVPLERAAILTAVERVLALFRAIAPEVARSRGLTYPSELDRVMTAQLEALARDVPPAS